MIPPQARYEGLSLGEWAAGWHQWTYGTLDKDSPANDLTGANFAIGQSGNVWFLAWPNSRYHTVRDVMLPVGKALLIPVTTGDALFGVPANATLEQKQAVAEHAAFVNRVDPSLEIDSVAVENLDDYRVVSPPFMFTFPAGNLYRFPPGVYGPDIAAGVFVLAHPLSVGEHTIHFHYTIVSGSFAGPWDQTYHITVVPRGWNR